MSPRHSLAPLSESMTLLEEVYRRPLDPGYREAARRRQDGEPQRRPVGTTVVVALAVLLGTGLTVAAVNLRQSEPGAVRARTLLEQEITAQRQRAAGARVAISTTSTELHRLQAAALAEEDPALLAQLRQDAVPSGAVAASGPGVQVVLTDAADAWDPASRVQDVDLRVVVNALWDARAEAVTVNDVRMTSLTAIRSTRTVVLVDLQPMTSPYTVQAVGDPETLSRALGVSPAGQHLATLHATYGIGVQVAVDDRLSLPGAGQVTLRYAQERREGGP